MWFFDSTSGLLYLRTKEAEERRHEFKPHVFVVGNKNRTHVRLKRGHGAYVESLGVGLEFLSISWMAP